MRYFISLATLLYAGTSAYAACKIEKDCDVSVFSSFQEGFYSPPVSASNELTLKQHVFIEQEDGTPGALLSLNNDLVIGSHSSVGNVFSGEKVILHEKSRVSGIIITNDLEKHPKAYAPEDFSYPGKPVAEANWSVAFSKTDNQKIVIAGKNERELKPGRYHAVEVETGGKLLLGTGTYYLDSLVVAKDGLISLNNKEGTTILYLFETLDYRGNIHSKYHESDILVLYLGSEPVILESAFNGSLVAPDAELILAAHRDPGNRLEHRGIFQAFAVNIESHVTVRERKISSKGAAYEVLQASIQDPPSSDDGVHSLQEHPENIIRFSDTEVGNALTDHIHKMYSSGPNAKAEYEASLDALRELGKAVIDELTQQYDKIPETFETQDWRWTLAHTMGAITSDHALEPLSKIALSPVTETPAPAYIHQDPDHPLDVTGGEQIIRARAMDGIAQLAKNGNTAASQFLLESAANTSGMLQRYAVDGYLSSGSNTEARIQELKRVLPEEQHYLTEQITDIAQFAIDRLDPLLSSSPEDPDQPEYSPYNPADQPGTVVIKAH